MMIRFCIKGSMLEITFIIKNYKLFLRTDCRLFLLSHNLVASIWSVEGGQPIFETFLTSSRSIPNANADVRTCVKSIK